MDHKPHRLSPDCSSLGLSLGCSPLLLVLLPLPQPQPNFLSLLHWPSQEAQKSSSISTETFAARNENTTELRHIQSPHYNCAVFVLRYELHWQTSFMEMTNLNMNRMDSPKSASLSSPRSFISRFCGFRSRWRTFLRWQYDKPRSNCKRKSWGEKKTVQFTDG